jgi:hypothetical protein
MWSWMMAPSSDRENLQCRESSAFNTKGTTLECFMFMIIFAMAFIMGRVHHLGLVIRD